MTGLPVMIVALMVGALTASGSVTPAKADPEVTRHYTPGGDVRTFFNGDEDNWLPGVPIRAYGKGCSIEPLNYVTTFDGFAAVYGPRERAWCQVEAPRYVTYKRHRYRLIGRTIRKIRTYRDDRDAPADSKVKFNYAW